MERILLLIVTFNLMLLLSIAWDYNDKLHLPRKHNVVKRSANINYTKILSFWKNHKDELVLRGEHKEVVLVMGNTGAGKTTLVSALTGRKLRSIMSKGYFVIVDDEDRIGTGVSSKTLIPEIMTDRKNNVRYVDCSGFRDNRNVEYEISSIYFQNILMNQVAKIKLILVINYDSLKNNGNKNDFDDLLERIHEFIKDIPKFHDGIALVATKVENTYGRSGGTFFLLNDNETVLKGIADYLNNKKVIYRSKRDDPEKYKKFVDLIDVLLQKKNDSSTRIAIFRQPTEESLLENLESTKTEIYTIAKMITENLYYVENQKGNFGFALSKSLKDTVDQIVDDIFRNALVNRLYKIGNETLTYYSQIEKQYNDIGMLRERVSRAYDVISEIKDVDEPQKLFRQFLNAANTLNITVSLTNFNTISDDIEALLFFTTVSNRYKDTHTMMLKNKMQHVIESIGNLKNIYVFLDNLQENLAEYKSQKLKNDNRTVNIITSCTNLKHTAIQNITDLDNIVMEIGSDRIYQKIETLKLNHFQLMHLKAVFVAFSSELEYSCTSSSEQMTVKGYNVKMSDVVKIDCWKQAKITQVFALNKIFFDCKIDKTGAGAQLFILAPTWEVIGSPYIILNGKNEDRHKFTPAKSAANNMEDGSNGLPGLHGGPAGNFFGVGRQFINSKQLKIYANGGNGGPGQRGGNGADGIAGAELSKSFFEIFFEIDINATRMIEYFDMHHFLALFQIRVSTSPNSVTYEVCGDVLGNLAKRATRGGDGGVGGSGGSSGSIVINGLGISVHVKVSNHSGMIGMPGIGGDGGKKTSNGRRVKFTYHYYTGLSSLSNNPYYSNITWIDGAEIPAGIDGRTFSEYQGRISPVKLSLVSPYLVINAFKDFVRMNLFDNVKESKLRTLINKLENDKQIKAQYRTLAFIKEFEGLEEQFLELRTKIDIFPFYDSFLTRVEEFSKFEKTLENKKVLSYLYTAALTKMITLKKTTKGETVVNLLEYLNIIETSIKEIREDQHVQIVRNYCDDYENTLRNKIQKANDFIENKIEPKIRRLWEESEGQIIAIVNEMKENINSTNDAIGSFDKDRDKIRHSMLFRSVLVSLKLAVSALYFLGSIGAEVSVAVTSVTSIADGMLVDITGQKSDIIYSVDPNLMLMSRVTEIYNNKPKKSVDKLAVVIATLEKYKEELSTSQEEEIAFSQKINNWKMQLNKVKNKKVHLIADVERREKDAEKIKQLVNEFILSRRDILEKGKKPFGEMKSDNGSSETLGIERNITKFHRAINHVQSILETVEIVFNFAKRFENNEEKITIVNNQISDYVEQLRDLEMLKDQMYNIVLPDFRQIERTVYAIKTSIIGSSQPKLDLTKWTVRSTLRNMKSLLRKLTYKMSFELQSNLQRYMENIDEGFSLLIDIYDCIDSYSDSVKEAEYMAYIVSSQMMNVQVTNSELREAMMDLKAIIQSNILFETYGIALQAFQQHYFPFATHVLQKFQLPSVRFNDTETLRSNILEKIRDMKNHINKNEATIGEYSKLIHKKHIFNSYTTRSSPFYLWKHDTIKDEVQQLLNGSEILLKADISNGVYYNAVKYTDIGVNLKVINGNLQNNFTSMLKNFALTMTMIGNNYYRCGERYYFISYDDNVTISYTLNQNEGKNWINLNTIYPTIYDNHAFLSPYGMWSIKLESINKSVSFDDLKVYANETIDLELIGQGYCIEQNSDFNFEVCNDYLDTFYNVENIVRELV